MSKKNSTSGNVFIYLVIAVVGVFVFVKFIGPQFGINLGKKDANSIEYTHEEGFPRALNVTEQFEKVRLVIKSEEELKNALAAVDKNGEIRLPQINWDRKIALFVTSVTRDAAGYETRIKKITLDQEDLIVEIRDTEPGDTCINTPQLTLPMDLVVLDKTDMTIEFEVVKVVKECN